jgi:hypothetical protein
MMAYLERTNGHTRDAELTFEAERHAYTIRDSKALTKPVSVTTLTSKSVWPPFDADATIDRILESDKYKSGESPYAGMRRSQIRAQWDAAGLEARVEGTKLHDRIEKWYNREAEAAEVEAADDPAWRQFRAWADKNGHLRPYRTEWRIFSRRCNVAGSVDMVFYNERTGALDIYDWKRAKEIKRDGWGRYATHPLLRDDEIPDANFYKYSLQLAAYKYILETEYELPHPIGELWLVRMDGDESRSEAEPIRAADMSGPIQKLMENRWA